MSGECSECGEHALECCQYCGGCGDIRCCKGCDRCNIYWNQPEEEKQRLLDVLNKKFMFHKDGTITRRDEFCANCKNELVACVCM